MKYLIMMIVVFFPKVTHNNNINYIDTAFCKKCNSNTIVYDIRLGDEEFEEMAKFLNIPVDKLRYDMRKFMID